MLTKLKPTMLTKLKSNHSLLSKRLTSIIMMNRNLGKHSIVLNFRFPQRWTVARDYYQLTYISITNQIPFTKFSHKSIFNPSKNILYFFLNNKMNNFKKKKKRSTTFGVTERAKDGLVTEAKLAALNDQSEPVVDALMGLLLHFQNPKSPITHISPRLR